MDESKNKAKKLELGVNELVCPKCKTILIISNELKSEQYIQCDNCKYVLDNPQFRSNNEIKKESKKKGNFWTTVIILCILGIIYYSYSSGNLRNKYRANYNSDKEINSTNDKVGFDDSEPYQSTISLVGKDGEVISESTVIVNGEEDNKEIIPNNDYEYSEKWRIKAYEATKDYLKYVLKKEHPDCHITGYGYYNHSRVKYIGDKGYRVSLYYEFKCGNDNYENRKNIWYEVYYDEKDKDFGFIFIKDKYVD